MEARLRSIGAWHIVSGTESPSSFTPPLDASERREERDYVNRKDMAAGEMWGCIEMDQQLHVQAVRDEPKTMWEKLRDVHVQKCPGTHFNTYNALLGLQHSEGESLTFLAARANQYKLDMKALRPSAFDITQLDDELTLMALIRALPAEHTSLRQTLLLDDTLTLSRLKEMFKPWRASQYILRTCLSWLSAPLLLSLRSSVAFVTNLVTMSPIVIPNAM